MKHSLLASFIIVAILWTPGAHAQEQVRGYFRSNGTYVQPYVRSAPDGNPYNNYSTRGNVNPYTGREGYVNPTPSYSQPVYSPPVYGQPAYSGYPFGH